jgi:hypothetical protein
MVNGADIAEVSSAVGSSMTGKARRAIDIVEWTTADKTHPTNALLASVMARRLSRRIDEWAEVRLVILEAG